MSADSTYADPVFNAAVCLADLHRDDEATRTFRRYLSMGPKHDELYEHARRWVSEHSRAGR